MKRDFKFEEWLVLYVLAEVKEHAGRFLEVMPASESGLEVKYESELAQTAWAAWQARQAEIDELRALSEYGKRYQSLIDSGLICETCGGAGFVGNPPDDYYDCPDCTDKHNDELAGLRAENDRLKKIENGLDYLIAQMRHDSHDCFVTFDYLLHVFGKS